MPGLNDTAVVKFVQSRLDDDVAFVSAGKVLAAATIFRDRESLPAEPALERDDQPVLRKILDAVQDERGISQR